MVVAGGFVLAAVVVDPEVVEAVIAPGEDLDIIEILIDDFNYIFCSVSFYFLKVTQC